MGQEELKQALAFRSWSTDIILQILQFYTHRTPTNMGFRKRYEGRREKMQTKVFRGRQDLVRYRTGSHMVFIRTLLSIFMMITPDSCTPMTFTMYSLPLSSEIQTPPLPTVRVCLTYLNADTNVQQPQFGYKTKNTKYESMQSMRQALFPLGTHKPLIKKFKEAENESKKIQCHDFHLLLNCK